MLSLQDGWKNFLSRKRKRNFIFLIYYFKQHTIDNLSTSKNPNAKWENIICSNKIPEKKFRLVTNSIKCLISWCNEAKALATPKRSKAVWIKIDPRAATGWPGKVPTLLQSCIPSLHPIIFFPLFPSSPFPSLIPPPLFLLKTKNINGTI